MMETVRYVLQSALRTHPHMHDIEGMVDSMIHASSNTNVDLEHWSYVILFLHRKTWTGNLSWVFSKRLFSFIQQKKIHNVRELVQMKEQGWFEVFYRSYIVPHEKKSFLTMMETERTGVRYVLDQEFLAEEEAEDAMIRAIKQQFTWKGLFDPFSYYEVNTTKLVYDRGQLYEYDFHELIDHLSEGKPNKFTGKPFEHADLLQKQMSEVRLRQHARSLLKEDGSLLKEDGSLLKEDFSSKND